VIAGFSIDDREHIGGSFAVPAIAILRETLDD